MRMDEGFPAGTTTVDKDDRQTRPLNQWRVWSARDPRRSIPNRAVKPGSAEGTGGLTAGRVGPCAIPNHGVAGCPWWAPLARRGAVAARRAHNPKVTRCV